MNKRIKELAEQAMATRKHAPPVWQMYDIEMEKFAELIAKDCIHYIETHRIPVGNSAAGEMACEWTYDALKSIRDEIKAHFGIKE